MSRIGRAWALLRSDPFEEPGAVVLGKPGGARVLVVSRRDVFGEPIEWVWADPDAAASWSANGWS